MSGKFSQPRPHRDEERQIEETFRQVTQPNVRRTRSGSVEYTPKAPSDATEVIPPVPEEKVNFPFPEPAGEETVFLPEPEAEKPQPKYVPQFSQDPFREELPDEETGEPDLVDKLMDRWENLLDYAGRNRRVVLITLCAMALVMICGFIGVLFGSFSDPYDKKILNNVTILDVQVGGMTKKEATNAVKRVADNVFSQPMVVSLSGSQITLNGKVTFNVKAAVEAAYDYGRGGTNAENQQAYLASKSQVYAVPLTAAILEIDEKYIQTTLSSYAQEAGATLTQTAYGLEGTQPELSADKYNAAAPGQTLVITMGTPGIGFDVQDVTKQVAESYRQRIFLVEVENVEVTKDPDPIDLRAIWEEFHIDPVEAAIDPKTNQATPGAYGYTFDLENARKLLDQAKFGDVIRIPMEYVEPELLDASAFFRDVLGEHQTRHDGNNARNTNLRLACEAINGTVLEPGETFSFNAATGQRTSARGYKNAPNDFTEYTTEFVAGGTSQVSSTLFYAVVVASMDVKPAGPGKYAPDFIEMGMDAQVTESKDLTFSNRHSYPVRIEAQMKGGYVTVRILGTEERDYYILMEQTVEQTIEPGITYEDFSEVNPDGYLDGDVVQEGITGYIVKAYCVHYDRQTNAQIKRNWLSTTNYQSEDQIVAKVEVPETTAPTVPPTVPPTTQPPATTVPTTVPPTTTVPPETTQPVTEPSTETTAPVTQPSEASAPSEGEQSQQESKASPQEREEAQAA